MNMKHLLMSFLLISHVATFAQMNLDNLDIGFDDRQIADKSYVYSQEKLKLYVIKAKPTLAKAVNDNTNYIPLEDAIKNNYIRITEVSSGGEVNKLMFENTSDKTIILQLGDVITGGKQDRVVNEEKILQPSQKTFVGVYCVEQGRWQSNQHGTAQFNGYHSKISNKVRKSIAIEKSQQAVWKEVAEINDKNETETKSGTYAAISKNEENKKAIKNYVDFYYDEFSNSKDIVGLLAVSGNEIIGCDIFGTTQLFQTNVKQILNSYATEAVINGSVVTISDRKVSEYLNNLLEDEEKQQEIIEKKGSKLNKNGKNLKISTF